MTILKIKGHESAQVKVWSYEDGAKVLVSYYTPVIRVDKDGWMEVNGLYSRTTIKHIGWFMRDYYNMTYQFAKSLYLNNIRYNIYTGEIENRP